MTSIHICQDKATEVKYGKAKQLLVWLDGERALTFALGLLITIGTVLYVLYTATGLALLPLSFIKSAPSISGTPRPLPTLLPVRSCLIRGANILDTRTAPSDTARNEWECTQSLPVRDTESPRLRASCVFCPCDSVDNSLAACPSRQQQQAAAVCGICPVLARALTVPRSPSPLALAPYQTHPPAQSHPPARAIAAYSPSQPQITRTRTHTCLHRLTRLAASPGPPSGSLSDTFTVAHCP